MSEVKRKTTVKCQHVKVIIESHGEFDNWVKFVRWGCRTVEIKMNQDAFEAFNYKELKKHIGKKCSFYISFTPEISTEFVVFPMERSVSIGIVRTESKEDDVLVGDWSFHWTEVKKIYRAMKEVYEYGEL